MVNEVLIVNTDSLSEDLTPAAGEIAVLVNGDTVVTAAQLATLTTLDAAVPQIDTLQFVVGGANGDTRVSKEIKARHIINVSREDKADAVAEVLFLGDNNTDAFDLNLPATLTAGTVAELKIVQQDVPYISTNQTSESYDYVVKTGDTKANVLAGLAANIAAGTLASSSAIGSGTANQGIQITAATAGKRLKLVLGGILSDADVVTFENANGQATQAAGDTGLPVPPFAGVGTYARVLEEYNYAKTIYGDTNRVSFSDDYFNDQFGPVAGTAYDGFVITWTNPSMQPASMNAPIPQSLKLFVDNTASTVLPLISVALEGIGLIDTISTDRITPADSSDDATRSDMD